MFNLYLCFICTLAHHLSLSSSMVRASHRSSESCGFDPRLGLRNHFLSIELEDRSSTLIYPSSHVFSEWVSDYHVNYHNPNFQNSSLKEVLSFPQHFQSRAKQVQVTTKCNTLCLRKNLEFSHGHMANAIKVGRV